MQNYRQVQLTVLLQDGHGKVNSLVLLVGFAGPGDIVAKHITGHKSHFFFVFQFTKYT